MKTVMIPNTHSMWEATINKKHYAYPGGTMQTVPDEVAALIEDITRAFPEPTPERVKAPFELAGGGPSPTPGGGLPDPSSLTDGTAMVAVNGEWKMQEGYGYTGDPAFEPIEWDGNTEGREHIDVDGVPVAFKISDEILTAAQFNGAKIVLDMAG